MGLAVVITARERAVLQLLCRGFTRVEIAARLGITLNTVKNHLANMRRTTGCSNIAQLSSFAVASKLVRQSSVKQATASRRRNRPLEANP